MGVEIRVEHLTKRFGRQTIWEGSSSGRRSGTASSSRVPSVDESGDAMAFGDYDPSSGRVITADGEQLSLGSTNGAQRVFGKDSWQWLLLGPLSR